MCSLSTYSLCIGVHPADAQPSTPLPQRPAPPGWGPWRGRSAGAGGGGRQPPQALITGTRPCFVTIFPGFASSQTNTTGYVSNISHHLRTHAGGRCPSRDCSGSCSPFPADHRPGNSGRGPSQLPQEGAPGAGRQRSISSSSKRPRNQPQRAGCPGFAGTGERSSTPLQSKQVEPHRLRSWKSRGVTEPAKRCKTSPTRLALLLAGSQLHPGLTALHRRGSPSFHTGMKPLPPGRQRCLCLAPRPRNTSRPVLAAATPQSPGRAREAHAAEQVPQPRPCVWSCSAAGEGRRAPGASTLGPFIRQENIYFWLPSLSGHGAASQRFHF